jgi:hypothetical protein
MDVSHVSKCLMPAMMRNAVPGIRIRNPETQWPSTPEVDSTGGDRLDEAGFLTVEHWSRYAILSPLSETQNFRNSPPPGRRRGSGVRPAMAVAVLVVIVAFLMPSMPLVIDRGDDGAKMCDCGCGNPEGKCCCAAPRTSLLALGCAERHDPNQPIDAASGGKIIGPPEPINLNLPILASAVLADHVVDFTDVGARPEVPPPRS